MKILICGCNGQLGKELISMLEGTNNIILKTDIDNLDITNYESVDYYISKNKPDVVINAAAFTNVDLCEKEINLAYKVNSLGPKNLAICSEKVNAKFVQISTDYVFDGEDNNLYKEYSKTNPLNVYGHSKLLGEQFTQSFCYKHFIIRTSWLYGDGNNFVKTMINLSKNQSEINVVNDQIGSPTSCKDLAICILNLINTEHYGIYHGSNNGQCSWYEFAKKIFEIKNIDIKVNPITSKDFKSEVKRPKFSVLDNFMLKLINLDNFRCFEDALKDYLTKEYK